jgi:hypothetical protein
MATFGSISASSLKAKGRKCENDSLKANQLNNRRKAIRQYNAMANLSLKISCKA